MGRNTQKHQINVHVNHTKSGPNTHIEGRHPFGDPCPTPPVTSCLSGGDSPRPQIPVAVTNFHIYGRYDGLYCYLFLHLTQALPSIQTKINKTKLSRTCCLSNENDLCNLLRTNLHFTRRAVYLELVYYNDVFKFWWKKSLRMSRLNMKNSVL